MVIAITTRRLVDGRAVAHLVTDTPDVPSSVGAESSFEGLATGRDPESEAIASLRGMYPELPELRVYRKNMDGTPAETLTCGRCGSHLISFIPSGRTSLGKGRDFDGRPDPFKACCTRCGCYVGPESVIAAQEQDQEQAK